MKPFLMLQSDLARYPHTPRYSIGESMRSILMVQVTNDCTNRCLHCTNRSGREGDRRIYVERSRLQGLWEQARAVGFHRAHLWGGETFLHPELVGLARDIFGQRLGLWVSSNGAFAKSFSAVRRNLLPIVEAEPEDVCFTLLLSCDALHQSQPATPVMNIARILKVASRIRGDAIRVRINSVEIENGETLLQLGRCLGGKWRVDLSSGGGKVSRVAPRFSVPVTRSPLEEEFGRAVENNIQGGEPAPVSRSVGGGLQIGANGDVFVCDLFVGDQVFPVANIFQQDLASIMQAMENNVLVGMLYQNGLPDLLLAMRKYVDVMQLTQGAGSPAALVKRLWMVPSPQFDKRVEVEGARQCLSSECSDTNFAAAVRTLAAYGDFSDVEGLHRAFCDPARKLDLRWDALFAYWALTHMSVPRPYYLHYAADNGQVVLMPESVDQSLLGMGERAVPPWALQNIPSLWQLR